MTKKQKRIYYISLFILFTSFMFLCPRAGDDWGNYLEGTLGIRHMIGQAIGMYFDWEGRFISRILINFLTYHKVIWNFLNSALLITIIYLTIKIVKPKKEKITTLLSILIILLTNIKTHGEVFVWMAGNITYLFVMPLILFYFYYILNNKNNNTKTIVFFSILNIIMTMFVEHVAVVLVAGNILILIDRYLRYKEIDKEIVIYIVSSTLGLVTMLLSPGSHKRSLIENVQFNNLSLTGKILYNLPNFIYYTFSVNYYLIFLMILANYYLIKKVVKNKNLKIISYLYLLIFPIINSLGYLLDNLNITILSINKTNPIIILYFISYILIDLTLIYIYTKKDKINKTLLFYLLGIGSNTVMLMSPTSGYRTSFATYLFLAISYLIIIDRNIKNTKLLEYSLPVVIATTSIFYLIMYISTYNQYKFNNNFIEKQLKEGKEVIEVVSYPYFVSCNLNIENDYHEEKFKMYYNIPKEKQMRLVNNNWKYLIFYQEPITN